DRPPFSSRGRRALTGDRDLSVKCLRAAATFLWCLLFSSCSTAQSGSKVTTFVHVNVVPMDGRRVLLNQNVTVKDDTIASVEPASAAAPSGAQVIDGLGKFLMPGLGEMHAHLPEPSDPPEYMRTTLTLYVANGVTTVRCMRGFPNHLGARQAV